MLGREGRGQCHLWNIACNASLALFIADGECDRFVFLHTYRKIERNLACDTAKRRECARGGLVILGTDPEHFAINFFFVIAVGKTAA